MFNIVDVMTKETIATTTNRHHAEIACVAFAKDAYENMRESESEKMQSEFEIVDWETATANDDIVKWFYMIIE